MSALPVPTLLGQNSTLRQLRAGDAPALQRHADDPAVALNLLDGFPQPYTLADADAWCRGEQRTHPNELVWGIDIRGEIAGCISLTPQDGPWACSATVGYWLGRAHWRRGVMSEALVLLTPWAWQTLPQVTRLWLPILARNEGSQAVARRAGYALEGRMSLALCKAGHAVDAVQYGCTRPGCGPGEHALPTP